MGLAKELKWQHIAWLWIACVVLGTLLVNEGMIYPDIGFAFWYSVMTASFIIFVMMVGLTFNLLLDLWVEARNEKGKLQDNFEYPDIPLGEGDWVQTVGWLPSLSKYGVGMITKIHYRDSGDHTYCVQFNRANSAGCSRDEIRRVDIDELIEGSAFRAYAGGFSEGSQRKGGVNRAPQTPRPTPSPKGQGV